MPFIVLWTLFTLWGVPLALGVWLGRRAGLERSKMWILIVQGATILFGILYFEQLRGDLFEWNTYFPDTPAIHQFGPNWSFDLLRSAAQVFKSGVLVFLCVFAMVFLRQRWMEKTKRRYLEGKD